MMVGEKEEKKRQSEIGLRRSTLFMSIEKKTLLPSRQIKLVMQLKICFLTMIPASMPVFLSQAMCPFSVEAPSLGERHTRKKTAFPSLETRSPLR